MRTVANPELNGYLADMVNGMKIIGRRETEICHDGLAACDGFLKLIRDLRQNKPFAPKGLYRFRTFEESDQWWINMTTRK